MKNLLAGTILCTFLVYQLASCNKAEEIIKGNDRLPSAFTEYTINQGGHSSQQTSFTPTEYGELRFLVKFDSTAIYSTASAENQYDINKLYGFSDNSGQHLEFSARIGWRWSEGALRLFGFTHNNGEMDFEELSVISIGKEHECSIKVAGSSYIFSVDGKSISMLRSSSPSLAKGYKLFPYFGGDETAPHDIHIWIKEK